MKTLLFTLDQNNKLNGSTDKQTDRQTLVVVAVADTNGACTLHTLDEQMAVLPGQHLEGCIWEAWSRIVGAKTDEV